MEAISTQVWSGEAAVHVCIVNWVKGVEKGKKKLFTQIGDHKDSPGNARRLILLGLHPQATLDVTEAKTLHANEKPKLVFQGQNPVHEGFFLTPQEAAQLIRQDRNHREILFPYMIGRDLVEEGRPTRWVIDFDRLDMTEAMRFNAAFDRVKKFVMPDVLAKAKAEKAATGKESTRWTRMANRWWHFRDYQPGAMSALAKLSRYIACPRVTKRPAFEFISSAIHPDNALAVFAFADDYSFRHYYNRAFIGLGFWRGVQLLKEISDTPPTQSLTPFHGRRNQK